MLRIAENGLLALQIVHPSHPLYWHMLMRLHMLELSIRKDWQVITTDLSVTIHYSGCGELNFETLLSLVIIIVNFNDLRCHCAVIIIIDLWTSHDIHVTNAYAMLLSF